MILGYSWLALTVGVLSCVSMEDVFSNDISRKKEENSCSYVRKANLVGDIGETSPGQYLEPHLMTYFPDPKLEYYLLQSSPHKESKHHVMTSSLNQASGNRMMSSPEQELEHQIMQIMSSFLCLELGQHMMLYFIDK